VSWRALYLLVALGFVGQALAAIWGGAPPWPNRYVWAGVAFLAALTTAVYAVSHRRATLRWATAATILASTGRGFGWLISDRSAGTKLSAVSVWVIVGTLTLLVYIKAGRMARVGA